MRGNDSAPIETREEEAPKDDAASKSSEEDSPPSGQTVKHRDERPLLAIVLDDCGGNAALARRVKSLDLPITWAIIQNLRYSAETAEMLRDAGIPFLVHLPMQADGDPDGKAGDTKTSRYYYVGAGMSEQEVHDAMTPLLDCLEGEYAVNNHRGSSL